MCKRRRKERGWRKALKFPCLFKWPFSSSSSSSSFSRIEAGAENIATTSFPPPSFCRPSVLHVAPSFRPCLPFLHLLIFFSPPLSLLFFQRTQQQLLVRGIDFVPLIALAPPSLPRPSFPLALLVQCPSLFLFPCVRFCAPAKRQGTSLELDPQHLFFAEKNLLRPPFLFPDNKKNLFLPLPSCLLLLAWPRPDFFCAFLCGKGRDKTTARKG